MGRIGVTWEDFLLAKDAILHRGEKLTVKRLIYTLGYGGSNLIARYLRKWRSLSDNVETSLPQEFNFMVAKLLKNLAQYSDYNFWGFRFNGRCGASRLVIKIK